METIQLQVPDEVALLYQSMNEDARREALHYFIKSIRLASHFARMDKIGAEAEQNGLTPEILEQILADNGRE